MKRVALIGDYNPEVTAHRAIPLALALAAGDQGAELAWNWVQTANIGPNAEDSLQGFDAIWCVPARRQKSRRMRARRPMKGGVSKNTCRSTGTNPCRRSGTWSVVRIHNRAPGPRTMARPCSFSMPKNSLVLLPVSQEK